MSKKFKTIITTAGAEKLAAATVPGGKKVNLTAMAVGDGGGTLPEPDAGQTKLINEVWRHALNKISQDNKNKNYIVAELVIPPDVGGFWMRELGLYDDAGTLIAVANMAESYKPKLAEGSGRAQTCRMVIIVSNVDSVALSIDATTVMATQDYVDDKLAEHEQSRKHPDATLKEKGFVQLSSATDSTSETLAATPKAVKAAYDLASGKYTAQDASTAQKGLVQLSSATDSTSETLAATPKAVKAAYDLANGKYTAQDASTTQKGLVKLSSDTDSSSESLAATPKAVKEANDNADKRLAKEQNGRDIPEKDLFVRNTGAARAFSGSVSIGGGGNWTTAEFIVWLEQQGAFNHPYWMCKGSWSYGDNRTITDTGCGNIQLAGAVVEVMGIRGAMTIRITTPTTAMSGLASAQFTYINHGDDYMPGWRRDFNTANPPSDAYPVGAPVPWPSDAVPAGYALMQGQAFDKSVYPLLAVAYPSGVIPDMRGQTIKGKPASGRAVLSQELDGIKSHDHGATVAATDIGNRDTTGFDYGTKTTNTTGSHAHNYTGPTSTTVKDGDRNQALATAGTMTTTPSGDHAHSVYIGAHAHSVYIGAHSHGVTVWASGQAENTVKNTAFNYIVRLA
ncbi:phage tail protein [Citrobacter sp. AATXR]|uniref:phage tail protein n=1 Tax=Citrobacter sp. AATXR TaxID=1779183 RepID=UPI000778EEE7|nr:phage tail protein [Citrobacter sp. AATXR]KYC18572.1 phage tail protein [Citrobacter sp. AATXR]HBV8723530.1 phage tail protein [Citrobacter freundii]